MEVFAWAVIERESSIVDKWKQTLRRTHSLNLNRSHAPLRSRWKEFQFHNFDAVIKSHARTEADWLFSYCVIDTSAVFVQSQITVDGVVVA